MIVDGFMFYNEIDMLLYRMESLNEFVDYFIIVESKYTHSGKEKPLFYNENKDLFKVYNSKIVHIILDEAPFIYPNINYSKSEQWENEHFHRNGIRHGIDKLKLSNEDIIAVSDLDEIPDRNILKSIKNGSVVIDNIYSLNQDLYYYNLNSKVLVSWSLAKILNYKTYISLNLSCQDLRHHNCKIIDKGGWHLSYFGDKYFIRNKIQNFGHQEFNNENYTDLQKIENNMVNQIEAYGKQICKISVKENNYLPYKYEELLSKYILY
jgi:beta-1,4-mannosyl-glycoprotein beta-1,4-N-acetylglucosaminyltransferase